MFARASSRAGVGAGARVVEVTLGGGPSTNKVCWMKWAAVVTSIMTRPEIRTGETSSGTLGVVEIIPIRARNTSDATPERTGVSDSGI